MVVGVHADEPGERCHDPATARPIIDGDRARLRSRLDRARPHAGTGANHDAGHSDRGSSPAILLLDSRRRQRINTHVLVHRTTQPTRVEYGRLFLPRRSTLRRLAGHLVGSQHCDAQIDKLQFDQLVGAVAGFVDVQLCRSSEGVFTEPVDQALLDRIRILFDCQLGQVRFDDVLVLGSENQFDRLSGQPERALPSRATTVV